MSTVISSPRTISFTWMRIGSGFSPNPSSQSVFTYSPSGRAAISARISRSARDCRSSR